MSVPQFFYFSANIYDNNYVYDSGQYMGPAD